MMRYLLFFLLTFSLCRTSFAQSEKRLIKEAEDSYVKGEKQNAVLFYLKALEKNKDNPQTNYALGKLYLETNYKTKSLPYLEKAYELKVKDKEIHKLLGLSYHYNHKFDQAIENYELYSKQIEKDDPYQKKIERKIYECNNGKEYVSNPVEAKIENIGGVINTKSPEFAPVISADESVLIFTSRREGSTGEALDDNGDFFEDIYISNKENGSWSEPANIGTNINTSGHDASIGLSADGKELFIYKDEGAGDIFYCRLKKDSSWSKPIAIEGNVNTKKSYENAAAISADGKKLFFASTREGGYGNLDLYEVDRDDKGNWGKPQNLGPKVNTAGDEEGPFFDLDGKTLYFSSKMHKGMGDYDLYKTILNNTTKEWSIPENLGYPINTADDDIYFVLSGDGKHGYYASVKEDGFGEKDIYMITMPPREDYEELVTKLEALKEKTLVATVVDSVVEPKPEARIEKELPMLLPVVLKGTIMELPSGNTLSATVQLLDSKGKVVETATTEEDGRYSFEVSNTVPKNYTVSAQKDGFGFSTKNLKVPANAVERAELVIDLNLKKLDVGAKFLLRNIYFDFDKATLKESSYPELGKLLKLLKENPSMQIELGGHTDSRGSDSYNKSLSQRRSETVVRYLINKGISSSRLSAKGYGEERPIASNDDEEEGRSLNRRTEFEVLKK